MFSNLSTMFDIVHALLTDSVAICPVIVVLCVAVLHCGSKKKKLSDTGPRNELRDETKVTEVRASQVEGVANETGALGKKKGSSIAPLNKSQSGRKSQSGIKKMSLRAKNVEVDMGMKSAGEALEENKLAGGPMPSAANVQRPSVDPFDPNYQTLKCEGADFGKTEIAPFQEKQMPMKSPFDPNYQTLNIKEADLGPLEQGPADHKPVMKSPFDPNYQTLNCEEADLGPMERGPAKPKEIMKSPFDPNYQTLNCVGADLGDLEGAPIDQKQTIRNFVKAPTKTKGNAKGADMNKSLILKKPSKTTNVVGVGTTNLKHVKFAATQSGPPPKQAAAKTVAAVKQPKMAGAFDPNYQTMALFKSGILDLKDVTKIAPPPKKAVKFAPAPAKPKVAGAFDPNYQTMANFKTLILDYKDEPTKRLPPK